MKFNLSTLSDISDGTHTVKVKAKADGYRDSEFSNEVEYTKAAFITFTLTSTYGNDNDRTYSYSTHAIMTTNEGVKEGHASYSKLYLNGTAVNNPITIIGLPNVKLYTTYDGVWLGYYINNTIHEQRGAGPDSPIEITLNQGDELKLIFYLGVDG